MYELTKVMQQNLAFKAAITSKQPNLTFLFSTGHSVLPEKLVKY